MKLRTRLILLAIAGVTTLGIVIGIAATRIAEASIREGLRTRGVLAAKQLALTVADDVIADRPLEIRRRLLDSKESDADLRYLYVIGLDGEVTAHTFRGGFPVDLVSANAVAVGEDLSIASLAVEREPVIDAGYRMLTGSLAEVHVGMSERSADAAIARMQSDILLITILGAGVAGMFVAWASRLAMRPLGHLAEAAERFGRTGEYRPVTHESSDEVGELTDTLNAMGTALDEQIRTTRALVVELEEHKEHLEALVSERTAQLEQRNAELEEATLTKSRFLANMSHELRTPLNSIIGFSGLLLSSMPGPINVEQRLQLEMVNTSGHHLLDIVEDILALARIESESIVAVPSCVRLRAIVGECVESMRPAAELKGLDVTVAWRSDEKWVECDERMMRQVLFNLVGNAIKFTDSGSVGVIVDRDEEGMLLVTVEDTGPGMPPEQAEAIFDDLTQMSTPRYGNLQGSGLGMPVSYRLVGMMNGTMEVRSVSGEGSAFMLRLPAPACGPPPDAEP